MNGTRGSRIWVALGAIACFLWCCLALTIATRWGIGLSPDSTAYLNAAGSLAGGHGLSVEDKSGILGPLTQFPPLYPVLLAAVGAGLNQPIGQVFVLNLVLLAVHALVVALFVHAVTRSRLLGVLAALFFSAAYPTLYIYSWVTSETLFNLLVTLALFLLYTGQRHGKNGVLALAAGSLGLAGLTRYAALPLLPVGFLYLLLIPKGIGWATRVYRSLFVLPLSALPLILLFAYNQIVAGNVASRELGFHPIAPESLAAGAGIVGGWLAPGLSALLVLWSLSRYRRNDSAFPDREDSRGFFPLAALVLLGYPSFLILSITFVDLNTPVDTRILSPVFSVLLVSLFALAGRLLDHLPRSRRMTPLLAGIGAAALLLQAWPAVGFLRQASEAGLGFSAPSWTQSTTLRAVASLPTGLIVYTNGPDVVRTRTGRISRMLPAYRNANDREINKGYFADMAAMDRRLERGEAVILWLRQLEKLRWYIPPEKDLVSMLDLAPLGTWNDGAIYRKRLKD